MIFVAALISPPAKSDLVCLITPLISVEYALNKCNNPLLLLDVLQMDLPSIAICLILSLFKLTISANTDSISFGSSFF